MRQPSSKDLPTLTVAEVLQEGQRSLEKTSSSPRLDSEVLLRHVLGLSQSGLIIAFPEPCPEAARERFQALIARRQRSEPIAYILGEREFWGLSFRVTSDVLIPRPESELLVEQATKELAGKAAANVADLGTGSGCLAIALVKELLKQGCQQVRCDAVDSSQAALCVAEENAERHQVRQLINFVCGSWCNDRSFLSPPYDCIVANPPYIDPTEKTPLELAFEPRSALYSEALGLADTTELMSSALPLLAPDGVLLCEVGAGKGPLIESVVGQYRAKYDITYLGDTSQQDRFRVVRAKRIADM